MGEASLWGALLGEHCDGEIWGFFVHPFVMLYCFFILAQLCDGHLTRALELLVDKLGMSEDVAGATFLAMASSAPELFTSLIATLVVESASGVGNILGSAVFNLLVIIGVVPIFAGNTLKIWWYPTARDAIFYMIAIIEVFLVLLDSKVYWYEGLIMTLSYFGYVFFFTQNQRVIRKLGLKVPGEEEEEKAEETQKEDGVAIGKAATVSPDAEGEGSKPATSPGSAWEDKDGEKAADKAEEKKTEEKKTEEEEEEEDKGFLKYEPIMFLIDKVTPTSPEWLFTMFGLCVLWIGFFTYFAVDSSLRLGCLVGMPDVVMGLIFLAAGTSVPDAMGSIAVAKEGKGDMAVANAVGSNTFDILLGLGLPWTIKGLIDGKPIEMPDDGTLIMAICLLTCCLWSYLILLTCNKFLLTKRFGFLLLFMYGCSVAFFLIYYYFLKDEVFYATTTTAAR